MPITIDVRESALFKEGLLEGKQEGLLEGKQEGLLEGQRKGLLEAIELGLELKFSIAGLELMNMVRAINTIDTLGEFKNLIRKAGSVDELKEFLGKNI